jgi:DNA repair protein RadC
MNENTILKVAEIEISYHPVIKPSERLKVTTSAEAEKVFRSIWELPIDLRESFYALYLDRGNKVLGYLLISIGGISGTVIDPKTVYQTALKANASGVIIAHYHPSGNPLPSDADKLITRKLKDAGQVLDINLLDHLILLPEGYTSLADEGIQ